MPRAFRLLSGLYSGSSTGAWLTLEVKYILLNE